MTRLQRIDLELATKDIVENKIIYINCIVI